MYAPPDSSRKVPMIHPATITIPMYPTVLQKPPFTDCIISGKGIPENKPKPMAASINAKNGCSLNVVVDTTIKTMQQNKMATRYIDKWFSFLRTVKILKNVRERN